MKKFILIILFVGLLFKGCSTLMSQGWKSSIPDDIELGRILASTTDWLGSPGGGCGGAIIVLKKSTALEIQSQGLAFFQGLSQPPHWKNKSISWTKGASDNRGRISFQCVIESSRKEKLFKQELEQILGSRTGYYGVISGGSKTRVLISTEKRLVFVGYWD